MSTRKVLPHFEVSKEGLAQQLARRPKAFIIAELWQNAVDEASTQIDITLEALGHGKYRLTVEDDNPEGFANLAHAYTLFARSAKAADAEKRGRFNLGEKLVIALCQEAAIYTTKGSVTFTKEGRTHGRKKRPQGSLFVGTLKMTKAEADECEQFAHTLIPPPTVTTTFNHTELSVRLPVAKFDVALKTEIADSEGQLKPTTRKTEVQVFDPLPGEQPMIYELGIPVVATEDRWHVNVAQKVPLNSDRDNVPPSFLRDLRTAVLNNTVELLSDDEAKAAWVTNALEDENVEAEVVKTTFTKRFGEKTVIYDPSDPEANKLAASEGYTVVPGGALPKAAWENVKSGDNPVTLPAGRVTPSPNPFSDDGDPLKLIEPDDYPEHVAIIVDFAREFGERLMDRSVTVQVTSTVKWPYAAVYGSGQLTLNLGRLGHKWFQHGVTANVIDLLIHEFGHEYSGDHLSSDYYRALTRLGGKATILALETPALFERDGRQKTPAHQSEPATEPAPAEPPITDAESEAVAREVMQDIGSMFVTKRPKR